MSLAVCEFLNRILKSNSEAGSVDTICEVYGSVTAAFRQNR